MSSALGKAAKAMDPYGNRFQCMILVMQCLDELTASNTKQAVLRYIREAGYYSVTKHDLPPYPGQNESRYHTLLAWARKDCVMRDLILNDERDAWALSRKGRISVEKIRMCCSSGAYDVLRCYLWTPKFKNRMCPNYAPSASDAVRPDIERENLLKWALQLAEEAQPGATDNPDGAQ